MFSLGRHRSCVQSSPGLVPVCHHADLKWPVDRCYLHSLLKCGDSVSRKLVFPRFPTQEHRIWQAENIYCKRLIVMTESGAQRASRVKGGCEGT